MSFKSKKSAKALAVLFSSLSFVVRLNNAFDNVKINLNSEIKNQQKISWLRQNPKKVALIAGTSGLVALLGGYLISREIAYKKLFPGQSCNIKEYLSKKQDFFNHQQRFDIETVEIKYQNGSLHGHIFMPLYKGKIEKVCVCFGGNGWYSFEMMNASMPCSKIAYVCIDYPGYGESTYQKIDEKIIDDFTRAC